MEGSTVETELELQRVVLGVGIYLVTSDTLGEYNMFLHYIINDAIYVIINLNFEYLGSRVILVIYECNNVHYLLE